MTLPNLYCKVSLRDELSENFSKALPMQEVYFRLTCVAQMKSIAELNENKKCLSSAVSVASFNFNRLLKHTSLSI